MFLNTQDFEFLSVLESKKDVIKQEFVNLGSDHELIFPYPQTHMYSDKGWDQFPLYAFGKRLDECCSLCPETTRLIEGIPGMVMAFFSILRAGAVINWHSDPRGYCEFVYRSHLGLITPEGCLFSVGEETQAWEEGKSLIFRGNQRHAACNGSDKDRVVLIVDVKLTPDTQLVIPPIPPSMWPKGIKMPSFETSQTACDQNSV